MANLEGMFVEISAKIDGLQSALRTATSDIQRFSDKASAEVNQFEGSLGRLRSTVLSIGTAWAAFRVGRAIIDAGMQMQALQNRMVAATGDVKVAADVMAFARQEAERLGLDFRSTAGGMSDFSAATLRAGLTLEETKRIFVGVSEAATALHLSSERVGLVFNAISQMANKQKVTMEELGQQLGDSLPGAIAVFAKAMGIGTEEFTKMISQGRVGVSDLKKLGNELHNQFGERAVTAAQSSQAAFARFGNAMLDMQAQLANSGLLDVVTKSVQNLTAALNDPSVKSSLVQLASDIAAVAEAGLYLVSVFAKISSIFSSLKIDPVANGFRAIAEAINPGRSQTPAVTGAAATPANPAYTLGKVSTPGPSDAQIKAAQRAAEMKASLRRQVADMSAGLVTEGDPNKIDAAKAVANLNKRYTEEQDLIEKALKKKAITEQEYRDNSLKLELDYQARQAEIRKQYRDAYLSDEQAFAEGFLGVQLDMQDKSLKEQGTSFRESITQAAQHNKAFFLLEKAAAIARALISARQSVVDAYAFGTKLGGPVLGTVFAGVAAAAQAANIAAIAATSYGGGGSSVSDSGGGGSVPSDTSSSTQATQSAATQSKNVYINMQGRTIYSKKDIRDLLDQIQDVLGDGYTLAVA